MKFVLVNYNFDPSWVKEYTDDYLIYDRSDDGGDWCADIPKDRVIRTRNVGNVDYDRLGYIVDNYHDLPEVFLLAKSNLFKYISRGEFDGVKGRGEFTPLLTKNHRTYMPVCFYDDQGMYNELNNSWYLGSHPSKSFASYHDFAAAFGLESPQYLAFAPGGNYILTRERVHRYGVDYYKNLRSILDYCQLPGEAQFIERSYHQIWK